MLDFGPMTTWRKLLTVVLLMLSLSARAFGAAPSNCEFSQTDGEVTPGAHPAMVHVAHGMSHGESMTGAAGHEEHHSHDGSHHHGGGHCSTCISCCFGGALPPVSVVATPAQVVRDVLTIAPPIGAVRFLTGGIERPPRTLLA